MKFGKILVLHTQTHWETNKTFSDTAVYKIINRNLPPFTRDSHAYLYITRNTESDINGILAIFNKCIGNVKLKLTN